MASMVPYRSVFGVRPSASSLFDLFDDMSDLANSSIASKAFPVDVEDKGDGYEVEFLTEHSFVARSGRDTAVYMAYSYTEESEY